MKLKVLGCCGVAVLAVLLGAVASAQTLGDVARTEEARRKTIKEPGKVYTNQDLKRDSGSAAPTPAPADQPAASAAAPPPQADAGAKDAAAQNESKGTEPVKDQAYWKGRIAQVRDQLDRSKMFLTALESRVNALNTDFVNRDDPVQRAAVEQDRQKALAEIDRVRKDIAQQTKAIADIEDEARRAGVPPSWLR
jgi:hypothetical protein